MSQRQAFGALRLWRHADSPRPASSSTQVAGSDTTDTLSSNDVPACTLALNPRLSCRGATANWIAALELLLTMLADTMSWLNPVMVKPSNTELASTSVARRKKLHWMLAAPGSMRFRMSPLVAQIS